MQLDCNFDKITEITNHCSKLTNICTVSTLKLYLRPAVKATEVPYLLSR